jgi:hypothetical protein
MLIGALPPHIDCIMMVGFYSNILPLFFGDNNRSTPPFVISITCELRGLGHVQSVGYIFVRVNNGFSLI